MTKVSQPGEHCGLHRGYWAASPTQSQNIDRSSSKSDITSIITLPLLHFFSSRWPVSTDCFQIYLAWEANSCLCVCFCCCRCCCCFVVVVVVVVVVAVVTIGFVEGGGGGGGPLLCVDVSGGFGCEFCLFVCISFVLFQNDVLFTELGRCIKAPPCFQLWPALSLCYRLITRWS